MFDGCKSLEAINVQSFNIQSLVDVSFMFYRCSKINNINLVEIKFPQTLSFK